MKWIKVDEYHLRFGDTPWTITYAVNALFPYGLYFNAEHKGNFKALPEAIAKYHELSNYA